MKDLGKVSTYLGINIEYDKNKNEMSLDQERLYLSGKILNHQLENSDRTSEIV